MRVSRRVLIVEDNAETSQVLVDILASRRHESVVAESVEEAKRIFDGHAFDLVLLDVNLKDGSGFSVCAHIRAHASRGATPVIMLTGNDALGDKARGFTAGADHYLTKPLPARELLLWVDSLFRRADRNWTAAAELGVPGLTVNPATHRVLCEGKPVEGLTLKEFAILFELARARPRTLHRDELTALVWGESPDTNTLAVHVKSLRGKLGTRGGDRIVTVKGVGYRLE